jgi:hypothetical protein
MHDQGRRDFLRHSAFAGLGLGSLGGPASLTGSLAASLAARSQLFGRMPATAKAVIHIHLDGGLSHIDTLDPKPDAAIEVRGPFGTVKSKLAGEPLSELLPRTADIADRLVVVRSFAHTEADHDRGQHSVLTGFQPSPALAYPSLGAVVAHELGGRNDLPPYVCIPSAQNHWLGTGYLSSAFAPFAVGGNPASSSFRVQDLAAGKDIDESRRMRRRDLLTALDAGFAGSGEADAVRAVAEYYQQAWALIESPTARAAFDLSNEPATMKARYGKHALGMGCLLARRLVQGGVRYAVVSSGGYDHHTQIATGLPPRLAELDQALAALVADLDSLGQLDETLVLVTSEFGRTPRLNGDGGRDHWPRVFSIVMAGGGCKRGFVLGSSDANGAEPATEPVHPADLAATVFTALGIDLDKKLLAPGNRPIDLVRGGRVLHEVLA